MFGFGKLKAIFKKTPKPQEEQIDYVQNRINEYKNCGSVRNICRKKPQAWISPRKTT